MEEEEGFEPPRDLTPLSVFKTDPFSQTWVFLRVDKNYNITDSNSSQRFLKLFIKFFNLGDDASAATETIIVNTYARTVHPT